MNCCTCTSKFILYVFNLTCALFALVVVGVSIAVNVRNGSYKDMLFGQITTVSIGMILVGATAFLIACLGCCGALKESSCMLLTYVVILTSLLIIQIALAIIAFVQRSKLEKNLGNLIDSTFDKDKPNDMVNGIQMDLQCCGLAGPKWWEDKIPLSCCGLKVGDSCDYAEAYQEGCRDKISSLIKGSLMWLGLIAIGLAVIELICVILAFCLLSSVSQWEIVATG